mmetsp:Transcript_52491/g.166942  ORF Transcript_52491/g.166942 Transcript_52491/m.166942 type:complete len:141 (+) Transcript_52491:560-982(+)
MEYSEFVAMLEKLGINVSEHKRRELFVSCDRDGQGFIDYSEFELAWRRLQLMIVEATLHKMGLTPQRIFYACVALGVLLIALMAFIFVGVAAFFGGGTVGAATTSGLTLATGGMAGGKKEAPPDPDDVAAKADEEVEATT